MLQAEPNLMQSTRVLPKSAVHSSCSRDVLLKIGRNLDRKPARQSSLPIHEFPTAVPLFIPTASNKRSLHLDFAAKQMLPAVPAWVPMQPAKELDQSRIQASDGCRGRGLCRHRTHNCAKTGETVGASCPARRPECAWLRIMLAIQSLRLPPPFR